MAEPHTPDDADAPEPARRAEADGSSDDEPDLLPPTLPSRTAFLLAFLSVVIAGVFGGIIGYGLVDVGCTGSCQTPKLGATLGGALIGAGGVGIVAVLVLRAMAEWKRPHE